MGNSEHQYDDMIDMPHHVSKKHPQMLITDRAAQFSPFAALTGYEAVIQETGRLTDRRIELDEYAKADINEKLKIILKEQSNHPEVTVTYFVPDAKKEGGAYVTVRGKVKKIKEYERSILLEDETEIPMNEIVAFEKSAE